MRPAAASIPRARLVLGLLACLATLACAERGAAPDPAPAARPNLILISIDTLRADRLGCYGYDRPTSPSLDRLASEGVLFERATANSPWTLPSHGSMLTGLFPKNHGLTRNAALLSASIPTLAELLSASGYVTLGLSSSIFVSERNGLHRGFDRFRRELVGDRVSDETYARAQVDQAIQWLEDLPGSSPFFLFWHNYDLHSNYTPESSFRALFERPLESSVDGTTAQLQAFRRGELELSGADFARLGDLYDGEIREFDQELGRFLAYLEESGLREDTVLVVTSDHGEEFGEHGGVLHGRTQYQEVLHVPLVVAGPGIPGSRRVPGLTQLSDVFSTLLELSGTESPPVDGTSLVRAWSEGPRFPGPERLSFAEADHRNEENDIKRAVRLGEWKLLLDRLSGESRLFDLRSDPGESIDVSDREPEIAERLLAALERYQAGGATVAESRTLTDDEIATLRSLGYID